MRMSSDSLLVRLDLHLSELQRVRVTFPVTPIHTVSPRGVTASQVTTVEVGAMTCTVPIGTFVLHCTWAFWPRIVLLIWSTELLSDMLYQWITFNTDAVHNKYECAIDQELQPTRKGAGTRGLGGHQMTPPRKFTCGSNMVFWSPICLYWLNCSKFGPLVLRKIIKIVATRWHILGLKCTNSISAEAPRQTPLHGYIHGYIRVWIWDLGQAVDISIHGYYAGTTLYH